MSDNLYHIDYVSQPRHLQSWEENSQYAPTPGYFRSPLATPSRNPSSSILLDDEPNPASRSQQSTLPWLQESDWEKDRIYGEDSPTCIHYFIEWRVTLYNKAVVKDTKEDFRSRVVNLLMVSKMTKPAGHNSMANAFRKMRIEFSKCQDI